MKVKLLFLALFAIALGACTEEDENFSSDSNEDVVVLKERDPNSPLILFQRQYTPSEPTTRATRLTFSDYLGRSFRATAYPYADAENLGHAVIDIKKLEADYNDYCTVNRIGHSVINSFSFASFDRYMEKSQVSKKVNSGFSINLGLFKIGHKRKMTEVFGSTVTNNTQSVFGELNVAIDQNAYEMQYSSNIRSKIMEKYLTATFKDELYNTPIGEFYNNYGAFVLKKFITGGRATAFYAGLYEQEATSTVKEKALDNEISGSFSLKNVGASVDLSFGKNSTGSGSSTDSGVTNISMAIETVGGSPAFPVFTIPQKLEDVNLDLSQWMASLADTTTHSIVDIADEGLLPISEFILEKNIKDGIRLYMERGNGLRPYYEEPQIIFQCGEKSWWDKAVGCYVYLYTRNHEFITLSHEVVSDVDAWINTKSRQLNRFYRLKIILGKGSSNMIELYMKVFDYDAPLMERSVCYRDTDGVLYILDRENKVGYSVHSDYLLDTYAIRNAVYALPSVDISFDELSKYTLVAL